MAWGRGRRRGGAGREGVDVVYALFAGPHLGAILGVVQAGAGLGGAIGPFLGGWFFDVTGSYRLAFMATCVAVAGSAVAAWFAARPMASAPDAQPRPAALSAR
jgi:MFS family permease